MNLIRLLFIAVVPLWHIVTAFYCIKDWECLRDNAYDEIVGMLSKSQKEVREQINSGNYYF